MLGWAFFILLVIVCIWGWGNATHGGPTGGNQALKKAGKIVGSIALVILALIIVALIAEGYIKKAQSNESKQKIEACNQRIEERLMEQVKQENLYQDKTEQEVRDRIRQKLANDPLWRANLMAEHGSWCYGI